MASLTSLFLYSDKSRQDNVIEVGLSESVTAFVEVEGIDVSDEKVIFEIRKDEVEKNYVIDSVSGNQMKLVSANMNVNAYKNYWVNVNTAFSPRILLKVRSNSADTLYFDSNIDLAAVPYGLIGGENIVITNIVKWLERPIIADNSSDTEGTSNVGFEWGMAEEYIGTSKVFGIYTVRAYWKGHETSLTVVPDTLSMEVVILSVWQLKNVYMAGIPLQMENEDFLSIDDEVPEYIDIFSNNDAFRSAILMAISEFERTMDMFLSPRKVVTNPEPGQEYDIETHPIDYYNKEPWLMIKTKHKFIISVEKIEGYFGGSRLFTWNPEWYDQTIKKKAGIIQMMPKIGGIPYENVNLLSMDFIARMGHPDHVPGFWHVDYTCGWDETDEPIPQVVLQLIGQTATIFLAAIWGDALSPGIASSSVSLDGVSESESKTASAIYGLFSAKINQFQKSNNVLRRQITESIIGLPMAVM